MLRVVGRLLLLFVLLPATELALLIELGSRFGTIHTLGLIVVTGLVGAWLARWQGISVLQQMQSEVDQGRLPADSLADGVIILLAAALLVTPGVLTDAFGFLCLVPAFRSVVKRALRRRLEGAVSENRVHLHVDLGRPEPREVRTVRELEKDDPIPRPPQ
ncbi:MAG: FxsA family protein [bacterium]|nr:FxsA family protein [bacterium]MCP5071095.1 FxsA family protein [bacterium]